MDYGNTKTPSTHDRLGSATLSQLAFPGESSPNFPWGKSHWDNTVVKKKESFVQATRTLQKLAKISGLKIKIDKTHAVWTGSNRHSHVKFLRDMNFC